MTGKPNKTKIDVTKKPSRNSSKFLDGPKSEEIPKSARFYRSLFNAMTESFALRELVFDKKGRAVDSRFIEANPSFEKFLGVPRAAIVGKLRSMVPVPQNIESFETYVKVADTGRPARFESYNKSLDKYFSVYVYRPERNQFATIFTDVTEGKRAEEALRESEEKFELIATNTPDHILMQDKKLRYTMVLNPQLELTEKDMLGKTDFDFLSKKDAENIFKIKKRVMETGKSEHVSIPLTSAKGDIQYFEGSYIPKRDRHSRIDGIIGYFRNVTEQKKLENLLQIKSKEQEAILDLAPAMIFYKDKENRFLRVNKAFGNSMGLPKERLEGKSLFDIYPKEQADAFWKDDLNVIRNGREKRDIIESMNTSQGTRIVQTDKIPYLDEQGKVIGVIGFAVDITERKRAEEAFKISEMKYRRLFESAKDGILILDFETGMIMDVNPFLIDWFGYSYAELLKKHIWDIGLFKDILSSKNSFQELQKKEFNRYENLPLETKNGKKMFVEFISNVYRVNDKKVIQCNIRDITARNQMEKKLRESEIKYRGVFENIGDMLATYEVIRDEKEKIIERKLLDGNPAMVRDAGARSIEEIRGKTVTQIYGPDYASDTIGSIRKIIDSRKTGHLETYFAKTDKSYLTIITPISDSLYLAAANDITIIKRAQANLNRLNRTLKALNGVNHAILNAKNEREFLNEVCRIIVQDCGHEMVWIGFANDDEKKTVKPAAHSGFENGYLKTLNISWADNERGQGPTGTAIRTGQVQQCKNMAADPKFTPWRDEALKRGYGSSIALPVIADQQTFGALTIYSKDPDPFTDDEISLLTELANDAAHGISTLRLRNEHARTAKDLRETSEYLDNLLTYANAPIIVWDPAFKITRFNRALENLTGIKAKKAIGKSLKILFPEPSKLETMSWIKSALAGKNWETVEIPILRQNGEVRTVIWNSANIKGDGEQVVATIAQGQDITARKIAEGQRQRAEQELKKHALKLENAVAELTNLQLAVENASDIIFIANFRGTILSVNKAAESILGYETKDITNKNISLFGSPVDPEFFDKMQRSIKKGGRIFSGEVANMSKDGKQRIFDLKTSPVIDRNGKILFFVGIMRDKTEAKEIDRAKTEFISLVAHQLRTPLSTMTMAAEMILNGNVGEIDAAAREQLKTIYDSAYKMAGLIELFLNLSRIELGRLEIDPEPVKMNELSDDVLKDIRPQARAKKIVFETYFGENLPVIDLDRRIIHIALENILANAIKYTPAGVKIVFAARVENNKIVYSVTDTGCGIPKSQIPFIFTKMFRADNVGDIKGMGLGLNMTKNIIEQGGGTVWFQSEENKGSTFSIAIPLSGMKKKSIRMES